MTDTTSNTPVPPAGRPELLAPAGQWEALEAALEAGADAVYFGLTTLNARRGAKNFDPDDFPRAVKRAHERGAKAYLTLNIDLTQRELGQAARILELARRAGVDGVLVRDPAAIALRALFPEMEFHFSTQTCMTSSADVAAAGQLGAKRAVLARELTLAEIAAASSVGVETEVFVQGALCFCVSGRCLLSSWVGGRSGNRGACTSPCRVPWTVDERSVGTPLSMRDLATVHRLGELAKAGVRALKIEGRLKSPAWVSRAVKLYRRALSGENALDLFQEALDLGTYTGRLMTSGYLDAERDQLTAMAAGRSALPAPDAGPPKDDSGETGVPGEPGAPAWNFEIRVQDTGILCRCEVESRSVEWTLPKTVVRRAHKALAVEQVLASFGEQVILGCPPGRMTTNNPEFLLVPRAANAMVDRIAAAVRQLRKPPEGDVRLDLPEAVRAAIAPAPPSPANILQLGDPPDRARLRAGDVASFLKGVRASGNVDARPDAVIVEDIAPGNIGKLVSHCGDVPLIVALPPVFFDADLDHVRQLLSHCAQASVTVEVNSWGGWWLAKQAGVRMESGPGLPVLNALAARMLGDLGIGCVTLSPEADRHQLEDITAHCPAPCSMVVYGRPALVITRARLADEYLGRMFQDRRELKILPKLERGLWVFRPVDPFDLRRVRNERIRVSHLVADLVASPDPLNEWLHGPPAQSKPFRFNYGRSLA